MNKESTTGYRNRQRDSGRGFNEYREKLWEKGDMPLYFRPESMDEAVSLLNRYGEGLKPLAGGTDLLVEYYDRLYQVPGWLDLSQIDGLSEINLIKERIEIGALVTHSQLERSTLIKRCFPLLGQAAADVGSPQIRNRGTIGGNIATASPAGDLLGPLLAYNARLELVSSKGTGLLPVADFFLGPKKSLLNADQLIRKIVIPLPGENSYGSWIKVGKRRALVISSISLALNLNLGAGGEIRSFRACFGSAGPTPLLLHELEGMVLGRRLNELDLSKMGELVARGISPIDDLRGTAEYRRLAASRIFARAVKEIALKAAEQRSGSE